MLSLVLIARRADYFSMVAGIAARCGAKPLWLRSGSEVQRLKGQCGVALLELEARSDGHDEATLACIAGLKTAGWSIFCYAPALRDWPIGMQCRPLLAGASRSLDSNVAGFEEELARRIEEQLQLCASSQGDRARLRQIMALRGIAGVSQSILDVFQWLVRVAPLSDLPVLITGETGTGKELFAHAVHTLDGKRCRGPFVAVNCGAISEGIAESELFGHRRGAFTGADRDRPGLFRAAQGGVLFLDEVGELSESVQSKLLRVLQDRRVLAVGDEKDASVNVRVIAATHRDLAERVAQGAFRADLFHRLTVLTLRVPPLRERREDMGPLIEHFLAQYGELVLGRPVSATTEFVQAISQLELPGNVRELENILRRILVCRTEGSALTIDDLPHELLVQLVANGEQARAQQPTSPGKATLPGRLPIQANTVLDANDWNLSRSMEYCERNLLISALDRTRGNHSRAARLLGITPRSVYNKIRKHRITP